MLGTLSKSYAFLFLVFTCMNAVLAHEETCPDDLNHPWSYNPNLPNGPQHWKKTYPMCAGTRQSPIHIESSYVTLDKNLKPLRLINYDIPISEGDISNDGHTVKLTPTDGISRRAIVNGTEYVLKFFDFHWSDRDDQNAAHSVDTYVYPFEAHFIHQSSEGVYAMIAVLFQVSTSNNPGLEPIVNSIGKVLYKNDKVSLEEDLHLKDIIDNDCSIYFYPGSQSVPPCAEGFQYVICKKPKEIGYTQLNSFRKIYSVERSENPAAACRVSGNVRPIQDRSGRTIYSSS